MNTMANVLLAHGASPAMAHAREEVGEFAALAGAVTLNIGTLSPDWVNAMEDAARAATDAGTPGCSIRWRWEPRPCAARPAPGCWHCHRLRAWQCLGNHGPGRTRPWWPGRGQHRHHRGGGACRRGAGPTYRRGRRGHRRDRPRHRRQAPGPCAGGHASCHSSPHWLCPDRRGGATWPSARSRSTPVWRHWPATPWPAASPGSMPRVPAVSPWPSSMPCMPSTPTP